ncbi:MAG: hypothetical protein ABSC56_01110 [Solirubrobacteraceae bacterium]|jgi:Rod binding domain-containing protein
MALTASDISSSLTAVNTTTEPASVRDGSPAVKQAYSEALDFESVLVNQLCEQMMQNSGLDSSSSSSDGSSGLGGFASLLPSALSSSIMSAGGLGLAAQLLPSFESADAAGSTQDGSETEQS